MVVCKYPLRRACILAPLISYTLKLRTSSQYFSNSKTESYSFPCHLTFPLESFSQEQPLWLKFPTTRTAASVSGSSGGIPCEKSASLPSKLFIIKKFCLHFKIIKSFAGSIEVVLINFPPVKIKSHIIRCYSATAAS